MPPLVSTSSAATTAAISRKIKDLERESLRPKDEKIDEMPCLIRETLFAPRCPCESVTKLLEVAYTYHNTSHYQLAIYTYIKAQYEWILVYKDLFEYQAAANAGNSAGYQRRFSYLHVDTSGDEQNDDDEDESDDSDEEEEEEQTRASISYRPRGSLALRRPQPHATLPEDPIAAYELARKTLSPIEIIYFRLAIGSVYESCANDELALAEYQEAKRYADEQSPRGIGRDHPDRAMILSCIGGVYVHLRQLEIAIVHYERALLLREQVLGKTHVDTAIVLNNLGVAKYLNGELTEAYDLFKRAMLIFNSILGNHHMRSVTALSNLEKAKRQFLSDFYFSKPTFGPIKIPVIKAPKAKKDAKKGGKKKKK